MQFSVCKFTTAGTYFIYLFRTLPLLQFFSNPSTWTEHTPRPEVLIFFLSAASQFFLKRTPGFTHFTTATQAYFARGWSFLPLYFAGPTNAMRRIQYRNTARHTTYAMFFDFKWVQFIDTFRRNRFLFYLVVCFLIVIDKMVLVLYDNAYLKLRGIG